MAGEVDELACRLHHGAALWCRRDGDPTAAAELEQTLVAQKPERSQHSVGVHLEHGGEVLGGRQSLAISAVDCELPPEPPDADPVDARPAFAG